MNFKEQFIFNALLEESLFELPKSIWKDIQEYYKKVYNVYKYKKDHGVLKLKKSFPINFENSSFDYLNALSPVITVKFVTKGGTKMLPLNEKTNTAVLLIDLEQPYDVYHDIEHEIVHLIQELIQVNRKAEGKEISIDPESKTKELDRLIKSKELIGGLPSKHLYPRDITKAGFIKTDKEVKKLDHHKRPIEYYPNLILFVRQLQRAYKKHLAKNNLEDSPEYRKSFFEDVYENGIKENKKEYETEEGIIIDTSRIAELKEVSMPLYKKLTALSYKLFVNSKEEYK